MKIGKYLTAEPMNSQGRKTEVWRVLGEDGVPIGQVKWYGPWRQYTFHPASDTVFHRGCLEDIAAFLKDLNEDHRAMVAARRGR